MTLNIQNAYANRGNQNKFAIYFYFFLNLQST